MVAGGAARSVIGQVVPLDVGLTMDVDDQATQEMDVETVNSDASPLLVPQAVCCTYAPFYVIRFNDFMSTDGLV